VSCGLDLNQVNADADAATIDVFREAVERQCVERLS